MMLAAQLIGAVGIICSIFSFQHKERKRVMLFQTLASFLFCVQLFMVGAVTGGLVDFISLIRTVIFSQNHKKWASSSDWLIIFIFAMVVSGIFTWQNGWSILPILGSVLSTVALWMKKASHIRFVSLFVGPCWFIYCLVHSAYTGALNEVFAMISIIIGIVRYDLKNKTKKG